MSVKEAALANHAPHLGGDMNNDSFERLLPPDKLLRLLALFCFVASGIIAASTMSHPRTPIELLLHPARSHHLLQRLDPALPLLLFSVSYRPEIHPADPEHSPWIRAGDRLFGFRAFRRSSARTSGREPRRGILHSRSSGPNARPDRLLRRNHVRRPTSCGPTCTRNRPRRPA